MGMGGGVPRTFNADPTYCEAISNVAKDRYALKKDDEWPPTFLAELQRPGTLSEATVHDIHP